MCKQLTCRRVLVLFSFVLSCLFQPLSIVTYTFLKIKMFPPIFFFLLITAEYCIQGRERAMERNTDYTQTHF